MKYFDNQFINNNKDFHTFHLVTPFWIPKTLDWFIELFAYINENIQNLHLALKFVELMNFVDYLNTTPKNKLPKLQTISLCLHYDNGDDVYFNHLFELIKLTKNEAKLKSFKALKLEFVFDRFNVIEFKLMKVVDLFKKLLDNKDEHSLHSIEIIMEDRHTKYDRIVCQEIASLLPKVTTMTSIKNITVNPLCVTRDVYRYLQLWYSNPFGECIIPQYQYIRSTKNYRNCKKQVSVTAFCKRID